MTAEGPEGGAPVPKFSDREIEGLVQKFPVCLSQQAANMVPRGVNAVRKAALEKGENAQAAVALWKAERKAKAERERAAKRAAGGPLSPDVAAHGGQAEDGNGENAPPAKTSRAYSPRGSLNPTSRRCLTPRVCAPAPAVGSPSTSAATQSSRPLPLSPIAANRSFPASAAGPSKSPASTAGPRTPRASDVGDLDGPRANVDSPEETWDGVDNMDLMPMSYPGPSGLSLVVETMHLLN